MAHKRKNDIWESLNNTPIRLLLLSFFSQPIFFRKLHVITGPQRSPKETFGIAEAGFYKHDGLPVANQQCQSTEGINVNQYILQCCLFKLMLAIDDHGMMLQVTQCYW